MSHCITCKHWRHFNDTGAKEPPNHFANQKALGICGRIPNRDDPVVDEDGSEVLAVADDMSGAGFLRTAADFGCTLWESGPSGEERR